MLSVVHQIEQTRLSGLLEESRTGGYHMIERLIREWESGEHTFSKPHERFLASFRDGRIAGVGGIHQDPYLKIREFGRIRHLYVMASRRRQGVGREIVEDLLAFARRHYALITVRTPESGAADMFYERLGFVRCDWLDTVTHVFRF